MSVLTTSAERLLAPRRFAKLYRGTAVLAVALISNVSSAAQIDHVSLGKGVEFIGIRGPIVAGDEETFSKLAVQFKTAVVAFDSEGGQLIPALEIGKAIHLREYGTLVGRGKECASACALMWIAGSKRFIMPTGKVGFHASYMEANGRKIESGVANALVGRYLTQLDLPESTIIFATSAGPDSIRWLQASDAGKSSISFELFDDDDSAPPAAPVARVQTSPPVATGSGGWRLAAFAPAGTVTFVNTDQVVRSATTVQFWQDVWWSETAATGANRGLQLLRANCTDKSYTSLQSHYYDGETYLNSAGPEPMSYAVPSSMIDGAITAICQMRFYSGAIEDRQAEVRKLRANK